MTAIFKAGVVTFAFFAAVACSKAGPSGEGQPGTPSPQTKSDPAPAGARTGDNSMSQHAPAKGAVSVYGIPLGAPYQDAVKAAAALFQLDPDGAEYHRGTGTLDSMKATLTMEGKQGRLVDVQLRLALDKADQTLDGSTPLARLEADVGKPAQKSADLATWTPAGFEITLQRQSSYARGQDEPRIEYTIRGRAMPVAAGSGPDPDEQSSKEREADKSAP